jgi:hypothetical protein
MLEETILQAGKYLSQGMDKESAIQALVSSGIDAETATQALEIILKNKRQKKRNTGMILIGIGTTLCVISLFYTLFFGHNNFMLFGLTILGVLIAFMGLIFLMG